MQTFFLLLLFLKHLTSLRHLTLGQVHGNITHDDLVSRFVLPILIIWWFLVPNSAAAIIVFIICGLPGLPVIVIEIEYILLISSFLFIAP